MQVHRMNFLSLIIAMALLFACSSGGNGTVADGSATTFLLNSIHYGRLVDVYDLNGNLIKTDLVIEPSVTNDANYQFSINPLTDQNKVTIQFAEGTSQFDAAYAALDDALPALSIKGPTGFGGEPSTPPFPQLPRNAALKLTFNNAVSSSTVNGNTVQLFQGHPTTTTFPARYIVDTDNPKILTIDSTISSYDQSVEGGTPNLQGFPRGISEGLANLKISIPTVSSFGGQFPVLRDIANNLLTPTADDPVENNSVVRVFRSALPGDTSVGEFLPDPVLPQLVAFGRINVCDATEVSGKLRVTYSFKTSSTASDSLDSGECHLIPGVGDVFVQGDAFGTIESSSDIQSVTDGDTGCSGSSGPYTVDLTMVNGEITEGVAQAQHIYVSSAASADDEKKPCFLDYSIAPEFMSVDTLGAQVVGLDPNTEITLHFTKPMNPATLKANDTVLLGNANLDPGLAANVASSFGMETGPNTGSVTRGSLVPIELSISGDLKSVTIQPVNPLRNDNYGSACTAGSFATNNSHYLHLVLGDSGLTDLIGNALTELDTSADFAGNLTSTSPKRAYSASDFFVFFIRPACPGTGESNLASSGLALRFNTPDLVEDATAGNQVIGGQFANVTTGQVSGRPVQRFSRVINKSLDPNSIVTIDLMADFGALGQVNNTPVTPLRAPLLPQGCRMLSMYRYLDVGFTTGDSNSDSTIDDYSQFNIDVEGLNWAPANNTVVVDHFSRIEIGLSHSKFAPDEVAIRDETTPNTYILCYPNSGLKADNFLRFVTNGSSDSDKSNCLEAGLDLDQDRFGPKNVYTGEYLINPQDKFQNPPPPNAPFTTLMPWPDFQRTFLWRDTRLVNDSTGLLDNFKGGAESNGFDPDILCYGPPGGLSFRAASAAFVRACTNTVVPGNSPGFFCQDQTAGDWNDVDTRATKISQFGWPPSPPSSATIPSIGLPLLMEFKVFPDPLASAANLFRGFQANSLATTNTTIGNANWVPFFRVISGGGRFSNGLQTFVNPDDNSPPRGEAVPASLGLFSQKADDVVYMGQIDFVTKTSIAYTRWFDTGVADPDYTNLVIEPSSADLAALGTSIEVEYRGATADGDVDNAGGTALDPYGNASAVTPATGWVSDIDDIDGYRAFQMRITFNGNADGALSPWLESLQVAWTE